MNIFTPVLHEHRAVQHCGEVLLCVVDVNCREAVIRRDNIKLRVIFRRGFGL